MNKQEIEKGISFYKKEQDVLLRLIRKSGGLTEAKFDGLFSGREWRKRVKIRPIDGDSFILGMGVNGGTEWAWQLDLLQHMVALGKVDTKRVSNKIMYVVTTNLVGE